MTVQEEGKHFTQRYRYDAFGRRLAKYNDPGNGGGSEEAGEESGTDYFGWDGDRLVHTERFNSSNANSDTDTPQPEVIHTVYEPGSFTPIIQLRRAAKAEPDLADELIAHMQPGIAQDALRGMFADIGATANKVNAGLGSLGMAADAQDFIREQLKGFEQTVNSQRQESAKAVEVRHYLCDHLGTPNALVNDQGQIEWAAAIDAWGNVKGEHNPKGMYQPIRLPGQHRDLVSDLSYNRHRYYESTKGYYLNQDPIGLSGGRNFYEYPINPINHIDPLGLKKFASNHPHCQGIRDKIAGLRKELDKRWGDIKANPQNMPIRRFPLDPQKGPLEQDVRGHMVIINDRDTKLRQWEKQYDKDCESDDDNNNGPGLGACVAVALIAVGLILAPEITLPVLVLAKATQ